MKKFAIDWLANIMVISLGLFAVMLIFHTFPRPTCTIAVLSILKSTRPDFAALTAPETSFVTDPSYIQQVSLTE